MKIAIVFPDFNLAYSPTTLGLHNALKINFDVKIVCIKPAASNVKLIEDTNIIYLKRLNTIETIQYSLEYYIKLFFSKIEKVGRYRFKRQKNISKFILSHRIPFDLLITIDIDTFWFYKKYSKVKCILLSLEIIENDGLIPFIRLHPPIACISQSIERFNFYFERHQADFLLLPNTFNFFEVKPLPLHSKKNLVLSGAAIKEFGLIEILTFIESYDDYKIVIKGFLNPESEIIINEFKSRIEDRIIIDKEYLNQKDLIRFLSQCRIGFCIYNKKYEKINTFNYETAPSGKLYAYLLSGTPIICSNQKGLNFIEENRCGICINNLDKESILNAVTKIESNYEEYSKNCLALAKSLSFDNFTENITEYIKRV